MFQAESAAAGWAQAGHHFAVFGHRQQLPFPGLRVPGGSQHNLAIHTTSLPSHL